MTGGGHLLVGRCTKSYVLSPALQSARRTQDPFHSHAQPLPLQIAARNAGHRVGGRVQDVRRWRGDDAGGRLAHAVGTGRPAAAEAHQQVAAAPHRRRALFRRRGDRSGHPGDRDRPPVHGARGAQPLGADRLSARSARSVGSARGAIGSPAGLQLSRQRLVRVAARGARAQSYCPEARPAARPSAPGAGDRGRVESPIDRHRRPAAARAHRGHNRFSFPIRG